MNGHTPYYEDASVTLYHGRDLDILAALDDEVRELSTLQPRENERKWWKR